MIERRMGRRTTLTLL